MKSQKVTLLVLLGLALGAGLGLAGLRYSGAVAAGPQAVQETILPPPVQLIATQADEIFRVPARPRDPGRGIHTATIVISYVPAGSTDPYGTTCLDWPAGSQAAFDYAATLWEAELNSTVPIVISACWANLGTGVLGYSGSPSTHDFPNAPVAATWYKVALANTLAGSDLNAGSAEMNIAYSGNGINWYFGTDGITPFNAYDFVSVVLHEICHGLNFAGQMTVSGGTGSWGTYPGIYDRFTENGSGAALLSFPNNSAQLAAQLTSNNVYFDGPYTTAANGGSPAKLYAPSTWQSGSSYSHLDLIFDGTVNALMTYSIANGESVHDAGPVTRGLLRDVGWPYATAPTNTPTATQTDTLTPTPTGSSTFTHTPTQTPTDWPTDTATATASSTLTRTPTPTPTTDWPTNTATATASSTLTRTPTRTPTAIFTNTSTNTPTATRTGTLTRTPVLTYTSTATATTCPAVSGYVRLGSATGVGLANVNIYRRTASGAVLFATTDANGFYLGNGCGFVGMTFWPELNGYHFEPPQRTFTASAGNDFVAYSGTSTATLTPTVTATKPPDQHHIYIPVLIRSRP